MQMTLLSTAAVVHVVQPRFEAPATAHDVIALPLSPLTKSSAASIARTALLVLSTGGWQGGGRVVAGWVEGPTH